MARKVGHAGTLDPFATGLLLVLVGGNARAALLHGAAEDLPHRGSLRRHLGHAATRPEPSPRPVRAPTRQTIRAALPQLTGEIEQRVPLTSAVKVGGERLYRKARRGEQFETPVRDVTSARLELLGFDEPSQLASSRSNARAARTCASSSPISASLCGAGAYCETLERTAIGPFRLERADERALDPLAERARLPAGATRSTATRRAACARNGRSSGERASTPGDGPMRLTADGQLVAVAERRDGC